MSSDLGAHVNACVSQFNPTLLDPPRKRDRKQESKHVGAGQTPKCERLESLNPAEAVLLRES